MNIFILDKNPAKAARYHADKHVNKMILESAQMLSTVLGGGYKPTHANHPCTKWVAQSASNAVWLLFLTYELNREAQRRYGHNRNHKSMSVVYEIARSGAIKTLPDIGLTPFAQAMPDEYKSDDAVTAYRAYYRSKPFVAWNKGTAPEWW